MNDRNVPTHPSGHPNKTAVNENNPIFGRPADVIPAEISPTQKRINDGESLEKVEAKPVRADAWTETKGEGLTADTSAADTGAEYEHSGGGSNSSSITPLVPVPLPTQEEAEAVKEQAVEETMRRASERFRTLEKVRFTPESGNDAHPVYTIDGGEAAGGQWFWRLVEMPGSLFLGSSLTVAIEAGLPSAADLDAHAAEEAAKTALAGV